MKLTQKQAEKLFNQIVKKMPAEDDGIQGTRLNYMAGFVDGLAKAKAISNKVRESLYSRAECEL